VNLSSISVIIPVYQSAERLTEHIASLRKLRSLVHEFIWVITESPDGTHQAAREAAKELGGHVLEVPRGLYQAWNSGIARATGEFIYISTIGDTITPEGLNALSICIHKNQADVVFSPPVIWPTTKTNLKKILHWPVFSFSEILSRFSGGLIPLEKVILMQILSGASGLLGSCASCLFDTFYLQTNLFPTQYYHYGDTAWTYLSIPNIVLAFHPDPVARFVVHDDKADRLIDKKQIYRLTENLGTLLQPQLRTTLTKFIQASQQIDKIRDPHPKFGWWWMPAAWIARSQRNKSKRALIKALQQFQ
jgi:glycosyltransferase involved in cell wall biosynthesis